MVSDSGEWDIGIGQFLHKEFITRADLLSTYTIFKRLTGTGVRGAHRCILKYQKFIPID